MVKKNLKNFLIGGLAGLVLFSNNLKAEDYIRVSNVSGGDNLPNLVGSSVVLTHREGGELGVDYYDGERLIGAPPCSPAGCPKMYLGIYSFQWNLYYGWTDYFFPLGIDNRPVSGPDANKPYPLCLDIGYYTEYGGVPGTPITSSNNCVYFMIDVGPDEGREIYDWVITLNATNQGGIAVFADGTYQKSGSWDLTQTNRYYCPPYHLKNVLGKYGEMVVTPRSKTKQYRVDVISKYEPWFGTNTIGNPQGAGVYPEGTNVTVSVDKYIYNPTNKYMRLRVIGAKVTNFGE